MIISMVVGAVIGEIIDLDRWITVFGDWVKDKTGNTGDPKFTQAFITASLTFTVGAMGVLGSIQDGLTGDYQTLLLKGILYGVIVMVIYGEGRIVFLHSCRYHAVVDHGLSACCGATYDTAGYRQFILCRIYLNFLCRH